MRRTENKELMHHFTENKGQDVFEPVTVCFMTKHASHVAVREVAFAALAQVIDVVLCCLCVCVCVCVYGWMDCGERKILIHPCAHVCYVRVQAPWAGSEDTGQIPTERLMQLYHTITTRVKFRWPPPRSLFPMLPPVLRVMCAYDYPFK